MAILPPLGAPSAAQTRRLPTSGWDTLELAGIKMPGFAKVTRASIKERIDHKKKGGVDGANPTLLGLDPQAVEVEIMTYTDADRDELVRVLDKLPLPGRVRPTANALPAGAGVGAGLGVQGFGLAGAIAGAVAGAVAAVTDKGEAIAIDHPSLLAIGITAVVIVNVGALIPQGPQIARMTMEFLHWMPTTHGGRGTRARTPQGAPVRDVGSVRTGSNPPPTAQDGFGGPPAGLKAN